MNSPLTDFLKGRKPDPRMKRLNSLGSWERALNEYRMNPLRALSPAAQEVFWTLTDPAEAWEALDARGALPAAWREEGARKRFLSPHDIDPVNDEPLPGAVQYTPPWLDAARAMAADPFGIDTAEALAREALTRIEALAPLELRHLGARPPPTANAHQIAWCFCDQDSGPESDTPRVQDVLRDALYETLNSAVDAGVAEQIIEDAASGLGTLSDDELLGWDTMCDTDVGDFAVWKFLTDMPDGKQRWKSSQSTLRMPVRGSLVRDYPNPMEPLLRIWVLGYVPILRRDGVMVLGGWVP